MYNTLITAQRMLLDLGVMMRCSIHNGIIEFEGRTYRLSFVVRLDVYEKLVAGTTLELPVAPLDRPCGYLFDIPLYVECDPNARLVSLVIEPDQKENSK